jgi:hypothetical protein
MGAVLAAHIEARYRTPDAWIDAAAWRATVANSGYCMTANPTLAGADGYQSGPTGCAVTGSNSGTGSFGRVSGGEMDGWLSLTSATQPAQNSLWQISNYAGGGGTTNGLISTSAGGLWTPGSTEVFAAAEIFGVAENWNIGKINLTITPTSGGGFRSA